MGKTISLKILLSLCGCGPPEPVTVIREVSEDSPLKDGQVIKESQLQSGDVLVHKGKRAIFK